MAKTTQLKEFAVVLPSRWRSFAHWTCGLVALLGLAGYAAAETDSIEEQLTSVTAWKPTMKRQGTGTVLIAYTPPLSSARQYTGANYQSDGKVIVVSLRSCLVNEECPTLEPALTRAEVGRTRWFEVAVPYQGERVVVEGDGPAKQELAFSR